MPIKVINPIEYSSWDSLLPANPSGNFFHTAAWARVLKGSYNYKPLYFTVIEDGVLQALIPIMEIKSFLTGKRGVSLPFTDECRPVINDKDQGRSLTKYLFEYGQKAGWSHIELRGEQKNLDVSKAYTHYYTHEVNLDPDDKKVFKVFKSNVKRNIKRAQKQPIEVQLSNTWESMKAFCRLNCMTRKQHGLPPQPLSFFKNIFKYVIQPQHGFVALALYHMKPIAGAVFFHHNGRAIYKYGASDRKFLNLRPNNLVMWEAIRFYCRKGFQHFNFGRTEKENQGLLQFKRGWGTKEEKIYYYKYNLNSGCFVSEEQGLKSSYDFVKLLPLPILRFTGNLLYRHVG